MDPGYGPFVIRGDYARNPLLDATWGCGTRSRDDLY
jgi:hypothetical protein